jgi:tRNA 2-thiouridine synthesizing protein A
MAVTTIIPDKSLDLSGVRCPHNLFAVIKAINSLEHGRFLRIITTDPNAPANLEAWCQQSGHQWHSLQAQNDAYVITIRCQKA